MHHRDVWRIDQNFFDMRCVPPLYTPPRHSPHRRSSGCVECAVIANSLIRRIAAAATDLICCH